MVVFVRNQEQSRNLFVHAAEEIEMLAPAPPRGWLSVTCALEEEVVFLGSPL